MSKYIKEHIDVKSESKQWALIKTSAFYKQEYKKQEAENEIIDSYMAAMECLSKEINGDLREGMCVLKTYSLCIPYLYICRHLLELILKNSIESKIGSIRRGHSILHLWNECKGLYKRKELSYYDDLIETMNYLDSNGEKFRYVKDINGNEFSDSPVFINVEFIKLDIIKLKNYLLQ